MRERNRGARVRRFTPEEAVEILEARAALESLAAGYAALRRTEGRGARAASRSSRTWSGCCAPASCSRCPSATPSCTAGSSRSPATSVARDICARLHSQVVRFQFRTVLAPGRPQKSLAEHRQIVDGDRRRRPRGRRAGDAQAPHERRGRRSPTSPRRDRSPSDASACCEVVDNQVDNAPRLRAPTTTVGDRVGVPTVSPVPREEGNV